MGDHFSKARAKWLISTLAPDRLTRIVDIGASPITPSPYAGLKSVAGCEIWGFEPNPKQFERLVARAKPNEHYLPYAVGDGATATLYLTRGAGFTSLYEPNRQVTRAMGRFETSMEAVSTEVLETRRLDDVEEIPEFDLLKIDIQGGEVAVFENGRRLLSSALAVITEVAAVPIYKDQPLLDDQMRSLRGLGFDLHKFLFFKQLKIKSPRTARLRKGGLHANQLIDGDAVFVRGMFDLAQHNDEALKHLIILADTVFDSFDLAAVLLGELVERGRVTEGQFDAYVDRLPWRRNVAAAEPDEAVTP